MGVTAVARVPTVVNLPSAIMVFKLGSGGTPLLLFVFFCFWGMMNKKQRNCDGQGGAQRPVLRVNEPKKMCARSARARTRGQNPLVNLLEPYILTVKRGKHISETIRVQVRASMLQMQMNTRKSGIPFLNPSKSKDCP